MELLLCFIFTLLIDFNLSEDEYLSKLVINRKSNYMEFQFPSVRDEREAAAKGIFSIYGPRNQPPYDIDIQYFSKNLINFCIQLWTSFYCKLSTKKKIILKCGKIIFLK